MLDSGYHCKIPCRSVSKGVCPTDVICVFDTWPYRYNDRIPCSNLYVSASLDVRSCLAAVHIRYFDEKCKENTEYLTGEVR